jgi:hypothetical protein
MKTRVPGFSKYWDEANANFQKRKQGQVVVFPQKMKVKASRQCGARMSSFFWFLRVSEWLKRFTYSPHTLGFKIQIYECEMGITRLEGVPVKPSEGEPLHLYRVLEFFSENLRRLDEHFLDPDIQLRIVEPQQTYVALNKCSQKSYVPDRGRIQTSKPFSIINYKRGTTI